MSPIELIKNGILNKNWSEVYKGYNLLTGENLDIDKLDPITNSFYNCLLLSIDDLAKKFNLPSILLNTTTNTYPQTEKTKNKTKRRYTKKKKTSQGTSNGKNKNKTTNKYGFSHTVIITDDKPSEGYNTNEEEQDANRKRAEAQKTKQTNKQRKPHQKYEIECGDCQQKFMSSFKPIADINQYCPKCLRKKPKPSHG